MSFPRKPRTGRANRPLVALATIAMFGAVMAPNLAFADSADGAADPAATSTETKTPDSDPTPDAKVAPVVTDEKEEAPAPDPSPTVTVEEKSASAADSSTEDTKVPAAKPTPKASKATAAPAVKVKKLTVVENAERCEITFTSAASNPVVNGVVNDFMRDGYAVSFSVNPGTSTTIKVKAVVKGGYYYGEGQYDPETGDGTAKDLDEFVGDYSNCGNPPPPPTCVKDSPAYVWGPTVVSAVGTKASNFVSVWDAENKADQNLIEAVKAGKDCMGSVPVPPAMCEDHQYQGDVSREEPPMNITDTNGDGIADIPGFIAGELFTVKGDPSLCTPPPPVKTEVIPADVTFNDICGIVDDTFTSPTAVGGKYVKDGKTVAAGTYPATGTVTVKFVADKLHFVKKGATKSWTFNFTNEACPPEVVIAPTASVVVKCDGSGTATLDNTKSTTQVGPEVVVNGKVTSYPVEAGQSLDVPIVGAKPGSEVIVQDDTGTLASATVPDACTDTPPKTDNPPKENPPTKTTTVVKYGVPETGAVTTDQPNNTWLGIMILLGGAAVTMAAGSSTLRRRK